MAPLNVDSDGRMSADDAESLFAMLIAEAGTAVVDVDREMLPKQRDKKQGVGRRHETMFACIIKYDKWSTMDPTRGGTQNEIITPWCDRLIYAGEKSVRVECTGGNWQGLEGAKSIV